MSVVLQRLVSWLLAAAVRRWPPHLRETVAREWAAELHELSAEAGVRQPIRAWRQVRFVSSLAVARPPGGRPVLLGWMRGPASFLAHTAWLMAAPLLTMLVTQVLLQPHQLILFGRVYLTPTSLALMTAESYLFLTGVAWTLGTLLARRRLRSRQGQPAGAAQSAWSALPITGGLLVLDGLARSAGQMWDNASAAVVASLCLIVVLPLLVRAAAVISGRGRHRLALAGAALAAPVVTLATMCVVALAAGRAPVAALAAVAREPMLSVSYLRGGDSPLETVLTMLAAFVFATVAVSLAYAIRLARPMPFTIGDVRVAAPVETHVPLFARSPWWQRGLLGGAAFCVIAWAVTLTYLTPNIGVQNSWTSRNAVPGQPTLPAEPAGWVGWTTEEGRLWMHELQLSAIVCAALCFLCAMAYRGRPVLPAVTGFAVLLAANMYVVRAHRTELSLLPLLAAGGLLLGVAMWWLSQRRSRPVTERGARRLVITITILAAILVPVSFFPRMYALGKQAPPTLLLVVVGLPTILAMLILMGMRATSTWTWRAPSWLMPAVPLSVGVVGVLYYWDGLVPVPPGDSPLIYPIFFFPLALPIPAGVAGALAIHGRVNVLRRKWWGLLLLPAVLFVGYAFALAAAVASFAVAKLVLFPMEYGDAYDGIAVVPGYVLIGLLLGFLSAVVIDDPRPYPVPTPQAAAVNVQELGAAQIWPNPG